MSARCMFCAQSYKSVNCPLLAEKHNSGLKNMAKELLVCANCSGQRTAADPTCPNIITFLSKKNAECQTMQRVQNITLRVWTGALTIIPNELLKRELKIITIRDEIRSQINIELR